MAGTGVDLVGYTMSNDERLVERLAVESVSFATPPPSAFFGHKSNEDTTPQAVFSSGSISTPNMMDRTVAKPGSTIRDPTVVSEQRATILVSRTFVCCLIIPLFHSNR